MPEISSGLARLSGMLGSVKSALRPAVLTQGESSKAFPLPFYRFTIYDEDGPAAASDLLGDILKACGGVIALRLPPSAYHRDRPVRSEVTLDLAGETVVFDGGLGLARCSLRGTHGVGIPTPDLAKIFGKEPAKLATEGDSAGFLMSQAMTGFFEGWAATNKQRVQDGKSPFRLAFSISNGSWTEYRSYLRWIVPLNIPTDERNSARPLEWAWAMSWWDLGDMPVKKAGPDSATPDSALVLAGKAQALLTKLQAAQSGLGVRNLTGILGDVKNAANQLGVIRGQLEGIRRDALGVVLSVTDTVRQVSSSATGILNAINPQTFGDEVLQNLRSTALDTRLFAGEVRRWETTLGLPSTPKRAPSADILPGSSLPQIAQQQGQGFDSWPALADKNGLRHPYVES